MKVRLSNDSEFIYMVNTEELRTFIASYRTDRVEGNVGLTNKYVFPCILEKFKDEPIKSIKIRGNYGN